MSEVETAGTPAHVHFECSLSSGTDSLRIDYTIHNEGPADLAVLDAIRSVGIDNASDYFANSIYVDLEGEHLHLIKGALAVPVGHFPFAEDVPRARRLAKDETRKETVRVAVPVRVRHPYRRAMLRGDVTHSKPAVARKITVSVGVLVVTPEVRLLGDLPAHPDLTSLFPFDAYREGQQLLSKTFELDAEIAVLDYEAFPWPA